MSKEQSELERFRKALEFYANRPEGMVELDRLGNPQPVNREVAREALYGKSRIENDLPAFVEAAKTTPLKNSENI